MQLLSVGYARLGRPVAQESPCPQSSQGPRRIPVPMCRVALQTWPVDLLSLFGKLNKT